MATLWLRTSVPERVFLFTAYWSGHIYPHAQKTTGFARGARCADRRRNPPFLSLKRPRLSRDLAKGVGEIFKRMCLLGHELFGHPSQHWNKNSNRSIREALGNDGTV